MNKHLIYFRPDLHIYVEKRRNAPHCGTFSFINTAELLAKAFLCIYRHKA